MNILFVGNYPDTHNSKASISFQISVRLGQEGHSIKLVSTGGTRFLRILQYIQAAFLLDCDLYVIDVFSGLPYLVALFFAVIARCKGVSSFSTLHGGRLVEFLNRYHLLPSLSLFDFLISPSRYLIDNLDTRKFIKYIPNPINISLFPYREPTLRPLKSSPIRLLWIRAFSPEYAPEVPIRALKYLSNSGLSFELTMIGPDGGLLDHCIKLSCQYGIRDNVRFVGAMQNNELYRYMHESDFFLSTSQYESFGVSLIETALCGTPIIAFAIGELPYLWSEQEINFVYSNTGDVFAKEILSLLSSRNYINKIDLARRRALQFNHKAISRIWSSYMLANVRSR